MAASRLRSIFFICCGILLNFLGSDGARYSISGPVVTLTLKEPAVERKTASTLASRFVSSNAAAAGDGSDTASSSGRGTGYDTAKPWLDLSSIRPSVEWSIQSQEPPLPNWVPTLNGVKAAVGYDYHPYAQSPPTLLLPSWIEGTVKFSRNAFEAILQPSHDFRTKRTSVVAQVSRGTSNLLARFGTRQKHLLEAATASLHMHLPYTSVSAVRVTPSVDIVARNLSCRVEAVSGGAARTKAVLNLEYNNPTLTVLHSLDARHTIAPEISLYNAKITYAWNVALAGGGSVQTKVDPISDIRISWNDPSAAGGSWTTDVRLPLEGTTMQALAADIRVRRQFRF